MFYLALFFLNFRGYFRFIINSFVNKYVYQLFIILYNTKVY